MNSERPENKVLSGIFVLGTDVAKIHAEGTVHDRDEWMSVEDVSTVEPAPTN